MTIQHVELDLDVLGRYTDVGLLGIA